LKKIAKAQLQSADEPLYHALAGCGLSLNFPVKDLDLDGDFSYPCFPPRDVLQIMASKGHFHNVLGVPVAHSDTLLRGFWEKYKVLYPEHDIFHQTEDVDYTHLLPYYIHGDGGRTYKKDPLLVLSFYNALGEGTAMNPVELRPVPGHHAKRRRTDGSSLEPGVNLLGNTLANRFLFTAMKTEHYKGAPQRFQTLMDHFANALSELWRDGFRFNGEVWRVAILWVCGDAPFLRECGNHNRSFSNVFKSSTSRAVMKGCCWLCSAGKTGGPPLEDVRITAADWVQTCRRNNVLPWDVPSPLLTSLPVDDSDLAGFYKPDLFHVWHAGVGKDFVGSALVYLMKKIFPRRKIDLSLAEVNAELQRWKKTAKEHLHFGKLTLDLLGFKSARTYPVGHWSKNMDTSTLSKFVEHLCLIGLAQHRDDEILQTMMECCGAIAHFMHMLFSSPFYLNEADGWQLIQSGQAVLSDYAKLAKLSYDKGLCLWKLKPKLHSLAHIVLTAYLQFHTDGFCINPIAESTFMCEDFVGRISRLSRRVSAKQHGKKIFYRYMVAAHFHSQNA